MTPLMRENHREPLRGVRIDDAPLLLADVFAWNKVYRRAFWDRHRLRFPERVSYEDQPTLTEFLSAYKEYRRGEPGKDQSPSDIIVADLVARGFAVPGDAAARDDLHG